MLVHMDNLSRCYRLSGIQKRRLDVLSGGVMCRLARVFNGYLCHTLIDDAINSQEHYEKRSENSRFNNTKNERNGSV